MKILGVIHQYLPRHLGGSELHAHQVARELVRRGHDVTMAATERDLEWPEGSLRRSSVEGVATVEMIHHREYADVRESYEQRLAGEVLRGLLVAERPDVVHFHHLAHWGSSALAAARAFGAKVVVTLHDYFLLCENAVLLRDDLELCREGITSACTHCLGVHPVVPAVWGAREASPESLLERAAAGRREQHREHLRSVDTVVCPSRFLADTFLEAGLLREEQVLVLKYGYPGAHHEPKRSDPSQPLRVGYLGGIYPSKGVHVLVDAVAHLGAGQCEVSIAGATDWFPAYFAQLEQAAQGLPIRFVGRVENANVDEFFASIDVLVVPSIWFENLPITIQESFRNGVPVVTTELGGMGESVSHEVDGLHFPRGDARALAACLERLASDRDELYRLASGRTLPPSLEAVVDRLETVYRAPARADAR